MIVARSPLRISFAGGGSDLSPFVNQFGGSVLSSTIDRYAYCTVNSSSSYRTNAPQIVDRCIDFVAKHTRPRMPIRKDIEVNIYSETSYGSGLGSSSALFVSCLHALFFAEGKVPEKEQLAKHAIHCERVLCGFPGGMQDQYSTVYGGFNYIEFATTGNNKVSPVYLDYDTKRNLQHNLILYNIGVSRSNNTVLERNIDGLTNNPKMIADTKQLVENCSKALQWLVTGNIQALAKSFEQNWKIKSALHSGIVSNPFSEVRQIGLDNGALGAKISGAGGGGHLLFIVDANNRNRLLQALTPLPGHVEYFGFTDKGSEVWTT